MFCISFSELYSACVSIFFFQVYFRVVLSGSIFYSILDSRNSLFPYCSVEFSFLICFRVPQSFVFVNCFVRFNFLFHFRFSQKFCFQFCSVNLISFLHFKFGGEKWYAFIIKRPIFEKKIEFLELLFFYFYIICNVVVYWKLRF